MQCDKVISIVKLKVDDSIHDQGAPSAQRQIPPAEISEARHDRLTLNGEPEPRVVLHDGFRSQTALMDTIRRVSLIAGAYTISTTALTVLAGFYLHIYGLGPIEMAVLNALSIIFFVAVMLPFSLLSAWCLRYNQESPVQNRTFDLALPAEDAFELSMAAMESLPGSNLTSADTSHGIIKYIGSGSRKCGPQEISVNLESLSADKTRISVTSHPKLSAIHYLLFGYTLAVDGSQNKRNVDEIVAFLSSCTKSLPRTGTPGGIC